MSVNMLISSRDSLYKLNFTGLQPIRNNTPQEERENLFEEESRQNRPLLPGSVRQELGQAPAHSFIHPSILPQYYKAPRYFIPNIHAQKTQVENKPAAEQEDAGVAANESPYSLRLDAPQTADAATNLPADGIANAAQ